MRFDAARKREQAHRHVGDAVVEIITALGLDLMRHLTDQSEDHRNIVRCERPQNIFLAADHAEIEPVGIYIADPAEFAVVDQLLQF